MGKMGLRKRTPRRPALLICVLLMIAGMTLAGCGAEQRAEAVPDAEPAEGAETQAPALEEPEAPKPVLSETEQWLSASTRPLSPGDMTALDDLISEENKIIFLGENHATVANAELTLAFAKYLHERFGLRWVAVEVGTCSAMALDRYLATGDESMLTAFMASTRGSLAYTKETATLYRGLRAYNAGLAEEERLRLIGVDVEHTTAQGCDALLRLMDAHGAAPAAAQDVLALLRGETAERAQLADAAAYEAALAAAESEETAFSAWLGADYRLFCCGLRALVSGIRFYQTESGADALREEAMYAQFTELCSLYGIDRCFGSLGQVHILLDEASLAAKLTADDAPARGPVLSIVLGYVDSDYLGTSGTTSRIQNRYPFWRQMSACFAGDWGVCPAGSLKYGEQTVADAAQFFLCVRDSAAASVYAPANP